MKMHEPAKFNDTRLSGKIHFILIPQMVYTGEMAIRLVDTPEIIPGTQNTKGSNHV
jgi:hypothetical protein